MSLKLLGKLQYIIENVSIYELENTYGNHEANKSN